MSANEPANSSAKNGTSKKSGTRNKTAENNSGSKIPPLMWAFTLVLAAGSALGGYVIGERDGQRHVVDQILAGDVPEALAEKTGQQGDGGADGNAATDNGTSSIVEAAALKDESSLVDEIPSEVKPGTDNAPAKAKDDGTYDATIFGPGEEVTEAANISNAARRDPNDPFAEGALDAPVVIAEFSDWNCSHCQRYGIETEPELLKKYVDSGLVRIEWNDMPIRGPQSVAAAKAGRAAAEQGRFADYKKAYLEAVAGGDTQFDIDDYVEFAKKAEVKDLDKFRADAESDKYDDAIKGALEYGQKIGLNGTPGFIVNDTYLGGAYPLEAFEGVINAELKKVADK